MTTHHQISPFTIFTEASASAEAKADLAKAKATFGLIPNVEGVMAGAPTLLSSYMHAWDAFGETTLSAAERQIVYQAANFENTCEYCTPWHTILSEQAGLSEEDVDALRQGAPLSDPKHEALRRFATDLIRTRGSVEPASLGAFFKAGYTEQHAMEVVLGLAVKTMSNYTNAIAQTPLDDAAAHKRWQKPSLRASNV